MSVRAFLALLGAFILIGAAGHDVVLISSLDGTDDGSGKPVVCGGNAYSSDLSTAPYADQDNEVGPHLQPEHSPD